MLKKLTHYFWVLRGWFFGGLWFEKWLTLSLRVGLAGEALESFLCFKPGELHLISWFMLDYSSIYRGPLGLEIVQKCFPFFPLVMERQK